MIILQAEKWLNEMGIGTKTLDATSIGVSRKDMVALLGGNPEEAYQQMLQELRMGINCKQLIWDGKDDEYLYLYCL